MRKKARRTRIIWECLLGAWIVGPALLWSVGTEDSGESEFFRTPTPHEAHLLRLGREGLLETPAGRQWLDAAYMAIDHPLSVGSAYQEEGLFPSASSQPLGLRIHIPEGQRLTLQVEGTADETPLLFLDFFRAAPDTLRRPVPLESGEIGEGVWRFDSPENADYILRLQPQVAQGGSFRVKTRVGAPFRFPVVGAGSEDIGGLFGDPRDGGRREHHGVDIFKPRGTPVLAAAEGTITSVAETGLGGRVVWQREAEGRYSFYYAHLDRQLVRRGQRVREGDTVGLVGNTGNARNTPPHLHFGIYRRGRGPVDPWNLIFPVPPPLPELRADLNAVGTWLRTTEEGTPLRRAPSPQGDVLWELPLHEEVRVLAGAGDWYRVGFPGGAVGYIFAGQLEPSPPSTP
ncbi:peptidoglycan DD-metalloendopeptidase family protein [Gemmatimonadota bacterium]